MKVFHQDVTQESQKTQTLFIRIDGVLHSFYDDCFRSNNVWEDRMSKRAVKHKDNIMSPVPKKPRFVTSTGNCFTPKC